MALPWPLVLTAIDEAGGGAADRACFATAHDDADAAVRGTLLAASDATAPLARSRTARLTVGGLDSGDAAREAAHLACRLVYQEGFATHMLVSARLTFASKVREDRRTALQQLKDGRKKSCQVYEYSSGPLTREHLLGRGSKPHIIPQH